MTGDRIFAGDPRVTAANAASARLARLDFDCDADGTTFIARQSAPYPFHICRPFYLPDDTAGMATVYLQSCAGGLFEGDRLELELHAAAGAKVHVTTSAATIVHSMPRGDAIQRVALCAAGDALLEFLPDPMILFPHARLTSRVVVRLGPGATVLLADSFLLHDPAAQDRAFATLDNEIAIEDDSGRVLALDRMCATGAAVTSQAVGVTGMHAAQGSFYVLRQRVDCADLLARLRAALDGVADVFAGASLLPGDAGVFVRVLARDAHSLRGVLQQAWIAARFALTGAAPAARRK